MILTGMSFSFYRIAAGPFFMRNSTRTERTYLFSFQFASMLLAGMVGSIGAGRMAQVLGERTGDILLGYQYTLYLGIAIGALALIPYAFIKSSKPSPEESRLTFSWDLFKKRKSFYYKITISNFLTGVGAGLIIPFLNLYFRDRFNMPPDRIGFFYFMVHCSMFAGMLVGPVLARKFGLVRTVVITQLLSIPFMLILSYSYLLPLAVFAFVLRGGLMNLGVPMITNLGMELSEKHEQSLVNALLGIAWTSSWMVSSALGGEVIERFGYTVTLNISIVIYVISTVILYTYFRNAERRTDDQVGWAVVRGSFN
jgi:predicted MFS family arabinose efflux permease